jgi:hypothetical protein
MVPLTLGTQLDFLGHLDFTTGKLSTAFGQATLSTVLPVLD